VSYNSQGNEVTLVKRLDTNLARKNAANGQ